MSHKRGENHFVQGHIPSLPEAFEHHQKELESQAADDATAKAAQPADPNEHHSRAFEKSRLGVHSVTLTEGFAAAEKSKETANKGEGPVPRK